MLELLQMFLVQSFFSEELRKAYVLNFNVFSTGDADVRHATDVTYKLELSDD